MWGNRIGIDPLSGCASRSQRGGKSVASTVIANDVPSNAIIDDSPGAGKLPSRWVTVPVDGGSCGVSAPPHRRDDKFGWNPLRV